MRKCIKKAKDANQKVSQRKQLAKMVMRNTLPLLFDQASIIALQAVQKDPVKKTNARKKAAPKMECPRSDFRAGFHFRSIAGAEGSCA